MTVNATPYKKSYAGNGVTVTFAVPFYFLAQDDLVLNDVDNATGIPTPLVITTNYTVAGEGVPAGGSVTLTTATATGHTLTIERYVQESQPAHFVDGDPLPAPGLEQALDRLAMTLQQHRTELDRSAKFAVGSTSTTDIPEPSEGDFLAWVSGKLRNVAGSATQIAADLLNAVSGTKGAALVAFNSALTYAAGSVGAALNTLTTFVSNLADPTNVALGDALAAVKRTLTGAISTTQHAVNEGRVIDLTVDFGADPTGVLDATSAFNAAIKAGIDAGAGQGDYGTQLSCKIVAGWPGSKFKILGTVIVPENFEIDLQGAMLIGSGYTGTDNVCFQTGYVSAGAAVSNDGTPENSHLIHGLKIRNANFVNFKRALNLWNVNDGCFFDNLTFYNCLYSVYSVYSFYAGFHNLFTRGSAGGATNGAYHFDYYSNVMELDSVFCQGRALGFEFYHACDGLELRNCSVEGGAKGIFWGSEVNTVKLDNCYFEALTGLVLDFSTAAAHRNVTVDNCFFNRCVGPLLNGVQMGSGCTWGRGNTITLNTAWVTSTAYALNDLVSSGGLNYYCSIAHTSGTFATDLAAGKWTLSTTLYLPDGQSNYMKVVQPDVAIVSPTADSILKTSNATLAKTLNVEGRTVAMDGGGNQTVVDAAASLLENPIPLHYFGKCTDTAIGSATGVPFCTVSGTTSIVIDTKIAYDDYVMGLFALTFKEAGAVWHNMAGRFYGLTAYLDNSDGGKTCTITAQAAADGKLYLRFTFATFGTAIANTYGVIRIA